MSSWVSSSTIASNFGVERGSVSRIAARVFLSVKKIGGRVTLYSEDEWAAYLKLKELGFKDGRATDYMFPCSRCKKLKVRYGGAVACPHCG